MGNVLEHHLLSLSSVCEAQASVEGAEVGVSAGMPRHGRAGINRAAGRVPVGGRRAEKISWGDGHGRRVGAHEVHFGLMAVVGLHVGQV